MDKVERAKQLRKSFKLNGGIPFPNGKRQELTRTQAIPNKGAGKPLALYFGVSLTDKRPVWVKQTDPLPLAQLSRSRRRKGENPFMRIAAHYPRRLPRIR
jgi:hypothetical protein